MKTILTVLTFIIAILCIPAVVHGVMSGGEGAIEVIQMAIHQFDRTDIADNTRLAGFIYQNSRGLKTKPVPRKRWTMNSRKETHAPANWIANRLTLNKKNKTESRVGRDPSRRTHTYISKVLSFAARESLRLRKKSGK